MILAKYQSISAVFVGSSGAVQFLKINMKNWPKFSYFPAFTFCDPSRQKIQYIHEKGRALSSQKEIHAFWYPSHPYMIQIEWSKWGKLTLLDPKQSLRFLLKIEAIYCKFKHLLRIFSHRFIWSSKTFMRGIIWRGMIPLCDIRILSWNIWSS